jgi:hypothetical protein
MPLDEQFQKEALMKAFLQYLDEEEASRHKSLDFIMQDLEAIVRTKDLVQRGLDSIDFWESV